MDVTKEIDQLTTDLINGYIQRIKLSLSNNLIFKNIPIQINYLCILFFFTESYKMIYDTSKRGSCYNFIRILWCGCFEPNSTITTKFIVQESWTSCLKVKNKCNMSNLRDVRRHQSCCCVIASSLPCCCVNDMADILLYTNGEDHKDNIFALRRISNSFEVFSNISNHLTKLHRDWRAIGRTSGPCIQRIV
eukprot:460601_1